MTNWFDSMSSERHSRRGGEMRRGAPVFGALHVLLLVYSLSGIFSKLASSQEFLSPEFILLYGGMLFVLFAYAVVWQQIIKRLPLSVAFANKAVTVVWGIVWGWLFFHEEVSAGMLVGAAVVMVGVVLYSTDATQNDADARQEREGE